MEGESVEHDEDGEGDQEVDQAVEVVEVALWPDSEVNQFTALLQGDPCHCGHSFVDHSLDWELHMWYMY